MTLSEIIKSNSWLSIKLTLEKLFPDEQEFWDDYEKVFNELKGLQPKPSNITIDIHWVHDDYDDTKYVDVSGYYTNLADRTNEYTNSLAIEFVPWEEWLGMPIDEKSLKEFTELELISYCLNEMTYTGFEQEDIQAEINRIKEIKDEYKSLTPEEKAKRTCTLEELENKFKNKKEETDENKKKDD